MKHPCLSPWKLILAAMSLLISASAFAAIRKDGTFVRETYFKGDWAQVSEVLASEPKSASAAPVYNRAELPADPDRQFHADYGAGSHMPFTRKAYEMYSAQYDGGELALFIGDFTGDKPASDKHDTVVAGAYEEDMPFQNPWNELMSFNRHFWDYKQGDYAGFPGFDSSVNRATKYWSGGYGINGKYDKGWSDNPGSLHGVKDLGVIALYKKGDKAKAYWYLGHVAHLLQDLTVPAHNLLWPHPFHDSDTYETYIGNHYLEWGNVPSEPIESFATLYDIFRKTGEITHGYDAGSGPGTQGIDGDRDKGSRRKQRFTEPLLKEEASVLMPLAYKRVAALFLYFYKQVDHTAPEVRLNSPGSTDPAAPDQVSTQRVILSASASDEQSGVAKNSWRFEYSRWNGSAWTPWRSVAHQLPSAKTVFVFPAEGGRFALRASASDAAGNIGRSQVKYLSLKLPEFAAGPSALPATD